MFIIETDRGDFYGPFATHTEALMWLADFMSRRNAFGVQFRLIELTRP